MMIDIALLAAVVVAAVAIRMWAIAIYVVPSESMLPGLMPGDFLLVEKWPYAVRGRMPRRGDIIVFHAPPAGTRAYVKRVIGLPGDTVALRHGALILNGRAVPRWRVADLLVPVAPATPCRRDGGASIRLERDGDGQACRYVRIREMAAGGGFHDLLDLGDGRGDDFAAVTVPPGRLFVLGDNRDRSADSRFPAGGDGGTGLVVVADLVGRAGTVLFSVDGSASLSDPRGWAAAVRWRRIGTRF